MGALISISSPKIKAGLRREKPWRFHALLWLILVLANGTAQAQMDEYSVKAGYLYNFSKYVTWPDASFVSASAPFVICVLGQDPFEGRLDQAIAGKTSGNGRPLEVKRMNLSIHGELRNCQIVFLGKSEQSHAAEIVGLLKDSPVLTVADFDVFAEQGGTANLRIDGTRVKVDLNVSAATHAGLKISARLQQVANLVH